MGLNQQFRTYPLKRAGHEEEPVKSVFARVCLIVIALSAIAHCALAAPPAPSLQEQAEAVVAEAAKGGMVIGVSAVEIRTGRVLVAVNDSRPLTPASNQKVLTSAFALCRLGGGFKFYTGVLQAGADLLVAGEGDPTLGDPYIAGENGASIYAEPDRWAAAVVQAGIKKVRNVLVLEDGRRGFFGADWPVSQRDRWYAAPIALLNFHDNCFDVTFAAAAGGGLVPVVRPESRFIQVANRLTAGGRQQVWSLHGNATDSAITLTGSVKQANGEPASVAVKHPPLLLGRVVAERLVRAGVQVGGVRTVGPGEIDWASATVLERTETPLSAVMRRACKRSLNMMAEAMFLRAGDGTWEGSREMMHAELVLRFGLRPADLTVRDGGGLSQGNKVTATAMTTVLRGVLYRPDRDLLLRSLAIGGVDGTLASHMTTPPCKGRVAAKTGYIAGVSTLSGYLTDKQGVGKVAFSVLCNRVGGGLGQARQLQETLCRILLGDIDRAEATAKAAEAKAAGAGSGPVDVAESGAGEAKGESAASGKTPRRQVPPPGKKTANR
jgi:D-alanyl-D-alanine carboxypeptidase/D-alanyl-D-alanine-endopeptidase (penicillin-binding protein 4)